MFISCKEAARLESESKDHPLGVWKRLQLGFHMLMCRLCRTYRAQLDLLSRISRQAGDLVMDRSGEGLPAEARERIKNRLDDSR